MPEKQPPSGAELKVIQLTRNVEAIDVKIEALDQRLDRAAVNIEAIIQQFGLFAEGLTRLEISIERQEAKLDRILDAIQGQTRVAEAQASNVAALTRLVEMLVSRN
jgi:hypothetical protein